MTPTSVSSKKGSLQTSSAYPSADLRMSFQEKNRRELVRRVPGETDQILSSDWWTPQCRIARQLTQEGKIC